ncbi:MAG: hydrolase [Pyrinomonadaceae bacterium]|nr:hydrolase [Pyrinomonadaceae bacterium]
MAHPKILESEGAVLVVVDVQEAFRTAIPDFALIASRISVAVRGFETLGLPVIVTEQYPKGLGRTAEEITFVLEEHVPVIEKSTFSSCGAEAFIDQLTALGAKQVVLCGVETHVCVNQTAHDLMTRGFEVHLLSDSVSSRFDHDKEAGIAKMYANGVVPSSTEMALFELMRDSKHEKFREVQELIK